MPLYFFYSSVDPRNLVSRFLSRMDSDSTVSHGRLAFWTTGRVLRADSNMVLRTACHDPSTSSDHYPRMF